MAIRDITSLSLRDTLAERLLTDTEFGDAISYILANSRPLGDRDIRFSIESVKKSEAVAQYSNFAVPESTPTERFDLSDNSAAVTCRCEVWRKAIPVGRTADVRPFAKMLSEAINKHWGDRDPDTLLPYLKTPGTANRFVGYAHEIGRRGGGVAVLHTDLDNFKAINTEFGEPGGDDVLREFASRFRNAFSNLGAVVRTGGEEYSGILPFDSLSGLLEQVESFRVQMATKPFERTSRANTCSIGLAIYSDSTWLSSTTDIDQILQHARAAEIRAKQDGKNCIRLTGAVTTTDGPQARALESILLTVLRSRSHLYTEGRPRRETTLEDAVARMLAGRMEAVELNELPTVIERLRHDIGLTIGIPNEAAGAADPLRALIAPLDWAAIVARSVLRATFRSARPLKPGDMLTLNVAADGLLSIEVMRAGAVAVTLPLECAIGPGEVGHFEIGAPLHRMDGPKNGLRRWSPTVREPLASSLLDSEAESDLDLRAGQVADRSEEAAESKPHGRSFDEKERDPLSPVLLLPIGDDAVAMADKLREYVAGIIDVDDRPVKGGGLPDFWQSNVSRIISACLSNPNINIVVAIGNTDHAKLTIERLTKTEGDAVSIFDLQRRLRIVADKLTAFQRRKLRVATVPANLNDIIKIIVEHTTQPAPLDIDERLVVDLNEEAKLRRLPIAPPTETNRLAIVDGLRVKTLADAYPLAVQLIRSRDGDLDHVEISRRSFRELSGFKVVLHNPASDRVPDYWRSDQLLLDAYYERNFVAKDGLFGRGLNGPFGELPSMLDFAVHAAADSVVNGQPTRRINLPIVPSRLDQPLGLSTIQIMPRRRSGKSVLDLQWVWRTVDALVGFPFSAYGSIRWSLDFLTMVQEELERRSYAGGVEMGDLTYIALSFHMYLHDGDMEIARAIVQDASR